MHHGQGGKSDEADIDAEKFFRFVAKRLMITIPARFATYTGCITRASKNLS
jgi:hypothetical protein